jgi:hypothetical protein
MPISTEYINAALRAVSQVDQRNHQFSQDLAKYNAGQALARMIKPRLITLPKIEYVIANLVKIDKRFGTNKTDSMVSKGDIEQAFTAFKKTGSNNGITQAGFDVLGVVRDNFSIYDSGDGKDDGLIDINVLKGQMLRKL